MASIPDYIGSALYAGCALVALLPVWDKVRQGHPRKAGWLMVAAFLLALVPLRLLGAEELARDSLRAIVQTDYDYSARGALQGPIAAALLALATLVAGFMVLWRGMDLRRPVNLAIAGVFCMAGLWTLRILSFHPLDRIFYSGVAGLRFHYLLELACLGAVIAGVFLYFRKPKPRRGERRYR
ncbi:hypothetical protein [Paraurantiacibacter namhicola]|uniref:Uncharacterized protein n=1 Tax=Paraurantiacibacter namhicola TaxID=645517 RepID=A0A1C7D6Q1_9SPHN|nr:hypothetical protein [Paraurantiacibacter namhicola]ANU07139.1 hypothetical protein A6F65_00821 [Paraurantiacibacter namhicola]